MSVWYQCRLKRECVEIKMWLEEEQAKVNGIVQFDPDHWWRVIEVYSDEVTMTPPYKSLNRH